MVLAQPFTTGGGTNTVFSWEDVIASIGYKTFSCLKNNEGLALITSATPSNIWKTLQSAAGTTELNFDHEFLAPADIDGTGFCSFTLNDLGGGTTKGTIRLIHVNSASSETELVAAIDSDGIDDVTRRFTITMTIPETHFAVGDKLRLEFKLTTAGASPTGTVWHDPANRGTPGTDDQTNDAASATLDLTIPFRIPV